MTTCLIGCQCYVEYHRTLFFCHILFVVYVNDYDVNLDSYVFKFADDVKVFSEVSSLDKVASLHQKNQNQISINCINGLKFGKCLMLKSVNVYILV